MERALSLELLAAALAGRTGLPTAEQLQQLMADLEVQLILRTPQVPQTVLDAAWYLHAIASVDQARERYTPQRQRQAFQVSAHIFDLALSQPGWSRPERLSMGFAAAIGYRRGGRDPNATAIMNRLRADIDTDGPVDGHADTLALEAGLAFAGFETRTLFSWFRSWRRQLRDLARNSELTDLTSTVFGPAHLVVLGTDDLLTYFAHGTRTRLDRGRARLLRVAAGQAGPGDLNARWVAAHLLTLAGEADAGSLWNPAVMPPTVPGIVRHAFTVGKPPVLTLWEPQRDLLTGARSPFNPHIRRMVLAVPTSGGKTLLAQLLATEHLSRAETSVCYVAPTRSLCREVRQAMASRVRILERETGHDVPDFPASADPFSDEAGPEAADVEVMTPERLAHLLRHNVQAVIERFGLFIFDEAQHMKDHSRGFTLESTIALLDYLTRGGPQRIVLISAAMGNAGVIAQWLDPWGEALCHESQWRGPRRLHAAFTTDAKWPQTRAEYRPKGRSWPYRLHTPLEGLIRLRMATGRTAQLIMENTDWVLVRKATSPERRQRNLPTDSDRSTKRYLIASQMIVELGHAGSVLIVAGTRLQAQQLALGLADELDENPAAAPLVDFVRLQLGDDHPLVAVLRKGVGFHHAGLPAEILQALEEAVRDDTLRYLTCTSTLTDGVNLPVRTVIIYDQAAGQNQEVLLRGARLVNAMGRAGRAGKETEGWIVLVRAAQPTEQDFRDLNPDAEALAVASALSTALEEFAELEQALRDDQDAVFTAAAGLAADFVSFVWLTLTINDEAGTDTSQVDLTSIVDTTLAAAQSPQTRAVLLRVAQAVHVSYQRTSPQARRRWARTGTSIGSARIIDALARDLAYAFINDPWNFSSPRSAIAYMGEAIRRLLTLPEAPPWRFRVSPQGADLDIDPITLLQDWLNGTDLPQLAERHLPRVTDPAWRIEQMVDTVTKHFEHYLAWTVAALVELANHRLIDDDTDEGLPAELGSYIRYGVSDPRALVLMTSGFRSRRLAHVIVADMPPELEAAREPLRLWLGHRGIAGWRDRYQATAAEILDLLDFTRERGRSLLKTLLETGSATVQLPAPVDELPDWQDDELTIEPVRSEPSPAPLAIYAGNQLIATIAARDHTAVQAILDSGLDLALRIVRMFPQPTLVIGLSPGDEAAT